MGELKIVVNGDPTTIDEGTTVAALLRSLKIKEARVAVEVNLDVIRRAQLEERLLKEGDRVEIVSFVGGGA